MADKKRKENEIKFSSLMWTFVTGRHVACVNTLVPYLEKEWCHRFKITNRRSYSWLITPWMPSELHLQGKKACGKDWHSRRLNHIYPVSSTVYSLSREFKFSQSVYLYRILETELINYSKTMDFVETNPFETGNFVCRSTHPTLVAANFVFFLNGILETNAVFVVVVCFSW